MDEVGQHVEHMPVDGAGHRNHRLQLAVRGPELPFLPESQRVAVRAFAPQLAQALFHGPRPGCLELHRSQRREVVGANGGHVFLGSEPQVPRTEQRRVAFNAQASIFSATHEIQRPQQALHNVEPVEYDLVPGVSNSGNRRFDVRLPHVHADSFNRVALRRRKACPRPLLTDVLHRRCIQFANQRHVPMPLGNRLLVDYDQAPGNVSLGGKATINRSTLHASGFIPGEPQQGRSTLDIGGLQDLDDQRLKHDRESGTKLSPRYVDLQFAVFRAIDPRCLGLQKNPELAAVQVAPAPLSGMVKHRQFLLALRTAKTSLGRVNHRHNQLLLGHVHQRVLNRPELLQTQQCVIQLLAVHRRAPLESHARLRRSTPGIPG